MSNYVLADFYISRRISFLHLADSSVCLIALKAAFESLGKGRDEWVEVHALLNVVRLSTHVRRYSAIDPPSSLEITQYFRCSRPIQ